MTETEMRESDAPWPESNAELSSYVGSLVEQEHDYGTCVYAMSLAATAAFRYVARKLGCTGFQASCADLDVLRRTRRIEGPFIVISARDMLYPQHDVRDRLEKFIEDSKPWLAEQAKANLNGDTSLAAPEVVSHWKGLAG